MKKALFTGFLLCAGAVGAARGQDKTYSSHLMVDQEVVVSSRIGGIVETIAVDRGSSVTTGQVLATLDPREADANVREAKEDMELARAEFEARVGQALASRTHAELAAATDGIPAG